MKNYILTILAFTLFGMNLQAMNRKEDSFKMSVSNRLITHPISFLSPGPYYEIMFRHPLLPELSEYVKDAAKKYNLNETTAKKILFDVLLEYIIRTRKMGGVASEKAFCEQKYGANIKRLVNEIWDPFGF